VVKPRFRLLEKENMSDYISPFQVADRSQVLRIRLPKHPFGSILEVSVCLEGGSQPLISRVGSTSTLCQFAQPGRDGSIGMCPFNITTPFVSISGNLSFYSISEVLDVWNLPIRRLKQLTLRTGWMHQIIHMMT
jgi:hypothetical protein